MCLYNMPEVKVLYGGQKCGNGYVEEGEECDCGEPEVRSRPKLCCCSSLWSWLEAPECAEDEKANVLLAYNGGEKWEGESIFDLLEIETRCKRRAC